jgi:hypothetical protein
MHNSLFNTTLKSLVKCHKVLKFPYLLTFTHFYFNQFGVLKSSTITILTTPFAFKTFELRLLVINFYNLNLNFYNTVQGEIYFKKY